MMTKCPTCGKVVYTSTSVRPQFLVHSLDLEDEFLKQIWLQRRLFPAVAKTSSDDYVMMTSALRIHRKGREIEIY